MLNNRISIPHDAIADFCRRWSVIEFALFGSVLGDDFGEESDIDVLLTFAPHVCYRFSDLDTMEEELSALFGRKVDIVDKQALVQSPNYIRRHAILSSAKVVYEAT
ncbi:MAG: hypothetical protein D6712_17565 [Chloroflexi bacterium]|nr:MAG: hypothetical protein D6712_17565 [Chloroflexota bacterium]